MTQIIILLCIFYLLLFCWTFFFFFFCPFSSFSSLCILPRPQSDISYPKGLEFACVLFIKDRHTPTPKTNRIEASDQTLPMTIPIHTKHLSCSSVHINNFAKKKEKKKRNTYIKKETQAHICI